MKKIWIYLMFGFWVTATCLEIGLSWQSGRTPPPEPELLRREFHTEGNQDLSVIYYHDFTAHYLFVREFWKRSSNRPYTEDGQREIAAAWLGQIPKGGLAFAYSPTLFLLLAPLLPLGPAGAYLVYGGAVLMLMFFFMFRVAQPLLEMNRNAWLFLFAAGCGISWFSTVKMGQNSVLTLVILAWVWTQVWNVQKGNWRKRDFRQEIFVGLILGALTAKPNMAVMVGVFLAAAGWWRALGIAGCVAAICALVFTVHLGGGQWMGDYWNLLRHYNVEEIGPFLAWSLDPKTNTNFLSALSQLTAVSVALLSKMSSVLWLLGMGLIFWAMRRRTEREVPFWFGLHLLWFLLVCPNLTMMEDLLLLMLALVGGDALKHRSVWLAVVLVLVTVNGNQGFGLWHKTWLGAWPVPFFAKLGLLVWWISLRSVVVNRLSTTE